MHRLAKNNRLPRVTWSCPYTGRSFFDLMGASFLRVCHARLSVPSVAYLSSFLSTFLSIRVFCFIFIFLLAFYCFASPVSLLLFFLLPSFLQFCILPSSFPLSASYSAFSFACCCHCFHLRLCLPFFSPLFLASSFSLPALRTGPVSDRACK